MSGNVIRTSFQAGNRIFSVEQLHQRGYSIEHGKSYEMLCRTEDVIALS